MVINTSKDHLNSPFTLWCSNDSAIPFENMLRFMSDNNRWKFYLAHLTRKVEPLKQQNYVHYIRIESNWIHADHFNCNFNTSIWHHVRQHSNIKWTYASASFLYRWRVSSDACSFGYLKSVLEFKLSISMCEKELWESMRLQVQTSRNLNDSDYTKKKRRKWNATCRKMKDQITKRKIIQFILFGKTNWWEQTIKLLFYRIKK